MSWKSQEEIEKDERDELNRIILEEQQRRLDVERQRLMEKYFLEQLAKNGEI